MSVQPETPTSPLHRDAPHESGLLHATGEALYVDDLPEPPGMVHAMVATSDHAAGTIIRLDVEEARSTPGVLAVLTAEDIPGHNLIGPITADEPILAEDRVLFAGQSIAVVVAETREAARIGAGRVRVNVSLDEPVLSIDEAIEQERFLTEPHVIARGDLDAAFEDAHVVVEGEVSTGAQDHFYLETQAALCVPDEDGTFVIHSSTQHPSEVAREAAAVLGVPNNRVVCRVPRMGGGFGGKESQASPWACLAALASQRLRRPVKIRLSRHQDMSSTGTRHPFKSWYRAAFDEDGSFVGFDVKIYSDGGWSSDLSGPVMDRGLFHLDNAYYIPNLRFEGRVCHTNLPSSTAFRGFGGPQGMVVVEEALNRAADQLQMDPAELRARNFYTEGQACPYGQVLTHVRLQRIHQELMESSDYAARRAEIEQFNASSRWVKRGIGFQPVKFGISFTASLLNQAGALVLVYTDGSVQLNHGGTEMGQGLHTKMRVVASDTLGVSMDDIRVMTTATDKVPNTSATAASSGSDLNGQAVKAACESVRERMRPVAAELLECAERDVRFGAGRVHAPDGNSMTFGEVANTCWARQISLSSTGYYATPGIGYDPSIGRGTPFFYYAYGGSVIEVEVDGRTGQHGLRRVDILHDVGDSLVPTIDLGQVEGAFVQGLGWLTVEEVLTGEDGRRITVGPSTYKIPSVGDVPTAWNVDLLPRAAQPGVIGGSKAVGEPPFMHGIAAVTALRHAIGAYGEGDVQLGLPATNESVLRAITSLDG